MSMLDKFRRGAQKAGIQATAFVRESSTRVASGSREFVQGFTLPGEAEKAAKILESFLGAYVCVNIFVVHWPYETAVLHALCNDVDPADPDRPESALNSIPKVVLQRARGEHPLRLPRFHHHVDFDFD